MSDENKKENELVNRTPGHFSNEEIKQMSIKTAVTKCPKCKRYPAQIGMDGKIRPCFKCEGDDLEKDFVF